MDPRLKKHAYKSAHRSMVEVKKTVPECLKNNITDVYNLRLRVLTLVEFITSSDKINCFSEDTLF